MKNDVARRGRSVGDVEYCRVALHVCVYSLVLDRVRKESIAREPSSRVCNLCCESESSGPGDCASTYSQQNSRDARECKTKRNICF